MQSKKKLPRAAELVILGAAAGAVVACGDKTMDLVGSTMEDAGDMLVDAGASMMGDAGDMLRDAGGAVRDAGGHMNEDARAQAGCASCTGGGAQRTIIASEDPAQLLSGFMTQNNWDTLQEDATVPLSGAGTLYNHHKKLADGPFVLTDFRVLYDKVYLYTVPAGKPCVERVESGATSPPITLRPPSGGRPVTPVDPTAPIEGARILVRADETLCANGGDGFTTGTVSYPGMMMWAGFRPYD